MTENEESKLAVLEERVNNWIRATIDYRKVLSDALDELKRGQKEISDILYKLPCDTRGGWYSSISRQVSLLWIFVAGIVTLIVVEWVKFGHSSHG